MIRNLAAKPLRIGIRLLSRCERYLAAAPADPETADDWVELRRMGFTWRLNLKHHIDGEIARMGVFEPNTTKALLRVVKPGMRVLDVGANIGYYTLLLAKAVGPSGKVWAFEPVSCFRQRLEAHVQTNRFADRVQVVPWGLSDRSRQAPIDIECDSATLHWTRNQPAPQRETIVLRPLDDCASELAIDHVDVIKVDIDGHEPSFLRGAEKRLRADRPLIALEFAQHCLHVTNSDVREQARLLRDLGYILYSEKTFRPFASEMDFLMECGNFAYSGNALAIHPDRAF